MLPAGIIWTRGFGSEGEVGGSSIFGSLWITLDVELVIGHAMGIAVVCCSVGLVWESVLPKPPF